MMMCFHDDDQENNAGDIVGEPYDKEMKAHINALFKSVRNFWKGIVLSVLVNNVGCQNVALLQQYLSVKFKISWLKVSLFVIDLYYLA